MKEKKSGKHIAAIVCLTVALAFSAAGCIAGIVMLAQWMSTNVLNPALIPVTAAALGTALVVAVVLAVWKVYKTRG